ncbi:hypothetical protein D3C77_603610 [compost metagenome]
MVRRKSSTMVAAPRLSTTSSSSTLGAWRGTIRLIRLAGIRKLSRAGMKSAKNWPNGTLPACHTIRVVMSPKGLKAPPALAATTMLMQARLMKRRSPLATLSTTVHIRSAVVRLSTTGEMKKARNPVSQNRVRRLSPARTRRARRAANSNLSSMALM